MSIEDDLRAEIAALKTQVAELQQRTIGDIRLGPRPETQEDIDRRTAAISSVIEKTLKHEHEKDHEGRQICTTSGDAPSQVRTEQTEKTGQHKAYIVLCEEERQKGFVRPYRDAYKHVGLNICGLHIEGDTGGTVCYMDPKHDGPCGVATGPRSQGCQSVTTMGCALSETYARDPTFYGATFCVNCNRHLPVAEFMWTKDGEVVGS